MSLFAEKIKFFIHDVDSFLSQTLKKEKLSKQAKTEKDGIIEQLIQLRNSYPQLKISDEEAIVTPSSPTPSSSSSSVKQVDEENYEYTDAEGPITSTPKPAPEDNEELYEDTENASGGSFSKNETDSVHSEDVPVTVEDVAIKNIPASEMTPDKVLVSGFLEKKRKEKGLLTRVANQYQKRWCAILNDKFYYYEKPTSKQQQGAFILTDYRFQLSPSQVKDQKKKDFCFSISCPAKRSFTFIAPDKEQLTKWKKVLWKFSDSGANSSEPAGKDPLELDSDEEDTSVPAFPDNTADKDEDDDEYEEPNQKPENMRQKPGGKSKALPKPPPSPTEEFYEETDVVQEETYDEGGSGAVQTEEVYDEAASAPSATPDIKTGDEPEELYDDTGEQGDEPEDIYDECETPVPNTNLKPPVEAAQSRTLPSLPKSPRAREPLPPIPPSDSKTAPTENSTSSVAPPVIKKENISKANIYWGLWDCHGDTSDELTFKRGDQILVVSKEYDNDQWWVGLLSGKVGLVPKNYLSPAYRLVSAS
ncbi:src kinase-associated phosphoprotein 2 isoform X2 [Lingula anatina]|uniref:Src kinase-associated phosphoprotein 2 isoform X2 n=1 Tax=Lingula anatina TaxID=7574 RepID=A0A1S3GZ46_LINAN|nr:src kinase-associated phosphoprotein 2 isoform X2 [Lingula anatina]|eukprot:XP_013378947.1 src kinase-associated phosphoprotein 2 isoform X2 [Lingula anatina]